MARKGDIWKMQDAMFDGRYNRICVKYTMEAWCKENPELCAYIILFCYEDDDINVLDIASMKMDLIMLFSSKAISGNCLAYKLYDQRGITLQVR